MTGSNRLRALALVVVSLGAMPGTAWADDSAAAAEALFQDAKRLFEVGDYAHACPKLEESQRLDPGIGTLYRLGDCYEKVGRTASAWAAFREVTATANRTGQTARAEDAKKRADALEPSLARLELKVAAPDTPGLVVKRGATELGRGVWSTPVPVDPGEVAIVASAPGHKPHQVTVKATPGAIARVEVPALVVLPPSATIEREPPAEEPRPFWSTQRTLAVVAGAAGVVGVGIGTAFGVVSMGKGSDAEADGHCDAANVCDDVGLGLRRDAISAGNVSTIAFVAGGVLLAGGAVLWFTAPKASSTRVGLAPRAGGLGLVMEMP